MVGYNHSASCSYHNDGFQVCRSVQPSSKYYPRKLSLLHRSPIFHPGSASKTRDQERQYASLLRSILLYDEILGKGCSVPPNMHPSVQLMFTSGPVSASPI